MSFIVSIRNKTIISNMTNISKAIGRVYVFAARAKVKRGKRLARDRSAMTVTCTATGPQLLEAASHGDTSTVLTLLSSEGVQSFINYQDATGTTPLNMAARRGHVPVTHGSGL